MFDAVAHHLSPDLFFVALAGHLVLESSAKVALHGARHLAYVAAVLMLPVLMQVIVRHEAVGTERLAPRARSLIRPKPARKRE